MRLSELNPALEDASEGAAYLEFDCPVHGPVIRHEHFPDRVRVKIAPGPQGPHVWGWNGERDFEKLTLTPSIHMFDHWHGFITNGEVSTV